MKLCAAHPWEWFAAMDLCVEKEIAPSENEVLDRISGTVSLNRQCRREAERRGIEERLMPVIQGWRVDHYLRCLDRMWYEIEDRALLGVGSMCRRPVEGQTGILQVVEAIDRALGSHPSQLHLFGLKSEGMEEVRCHPRVQSVDSQAYGTEARQEAGKRRGDEPDFSKSNVFTAKIMSDWYNRQQRRLEKPPRAFRAPSALLELVPALNRDSYERRVEEAREALRELVESGDLEPNNLSDEWAYQWAFDVGEYEEEQKQACG